MPQIKARPERSQRIRRSWKIKPIQKPTPLKEGKRDTTGRLKGKG